MEQVNILGYDKARYVAQYPLSLPENRLVIYELKGLVFIPHHHLYDHIIHDEPSSLNCPNERRGSCTSRPD